MAHSQTAALDDAGRSAAWSPEGYDGETHFGYVLKAMTPAIGILVVAAALLFVVL